MDAQSRKAKNGESSELSGFAPHRACYLSHSVSDYFRQSMSACIHLIHKCIYVCMYNCRSIYGLQFETKLLSDL